MTARIVVDPNTYALGEGLPSEVVITFDFGVDVDIKLIRMTALVSSPVYHIRYTVHYSFDNVVFTYAYSTIADNVETFRTWLNKAGVEGVTSRYVYVKLIEGSGVVNKLSNYRNITIEVNDLIIDSVHFEPATTELQLSPTFSGYAMNMSDELFMSFPHIVTQIDDGGGTSPVEPDPTHEHLIQGNVSKLNLPFEANVVAVSLGVDSEVVGRTVNDPVTGDYTIDVYPHTDEVLLYVSPEYGRAFSANLFITAGQVIHPTTPNKRVYVAQNDGVVGLEEPEWGAGTIVSNEVTFSPTPLYRPLMNGFIKPTIVPL